MNRRSHVLGHVMTLQIFGAPKICAFGGILKRCSIDSTPQVALKKKKGYVRSHVRYISSCLTMIKRKEK